MSLENSASPTVGLLSSPVVPLDSLLSPQAEDFEQRVPERDSIAESDFNDVALDDDSRFSTVALSERQSVIEDTLPGTEDDTKERSASPPLTSSDPFKPTSHKKSASTTTIRSVGNLPFILARLDIQKAQDDTSRRVSIDGQHKIHEEFVRLQKGKEEEEENAVNAAIDWGTLENYERPSYPNALFVHRLLGGRYLWYVENKFSAYLFLHGSSQTTKNLRHLNQRNLLERLRKGFQTLFAE